MAVAVMPTTRAMNTFILILTEVDYVVDSVVVALKGAMSSE